MNYLGHKATAVVLFPLIIFPIQDTNLSVDIEIIDNYLLFVQDTFKNFLTLSSNKPLIMLLSIIMYWIGSTLIDFIDFKIIRRFIPHDKRAYPYYYHRQWTHGFIDNLFFLFLSLHLIQTSEAFYILFFYFLGVWTHLIVDMLSGSIPIFFYGNYAKSMSRIGINRIMPKEAHEFFAKKIPKLYDKLSPVIFVIGAILFFAYNGVELLINPLFINNF